MFILTFTMDPVGYGTYISLILCSLYSGTVGIYVDVGNPYADGPLLTAELPISKTIDGSPIHCVAYFPLEANDYPVIYFIGGLSSDVPAEVYSTFLRKVASHGFYMFGVDYNFPFAINKLATDPGNRVFNNLKQDIDTYIKQLEFLQTFMVGKTIGRPLWNMTGIMSHSAGGDIALKILLLNKFPFKSTVFLEPYSQLVHTSKGLNDTVPGLLYGTQLAEEGYPHCNIKGYDFVQFYKLWHCPKIALEVADFGHCDILDPVAWEGCHVTHFCKTTNNTRLDQYKKFVQGVTASFFITTLQGRADAINFIIDPSKSPLRLLTDQSMWNC